MQPISTSCPCCGDPEPGYVWFSDGGDTDWVAPCPECGGEGELSFTPGEMDAVVEVKHPRVGRGWLCQKFPFGQLLFVDRENEAWVVNRQTLETPFRLVPTPQTPAMLSDAA